MRVVVGTIALLIIWYLGTRVIQLFDNSNIQRTSAVLSLDGTSSENVQVSLQGSNESQRAENNLKIYAGDSITTRSGGHATIRFFDGSTVQIDENGSITLSHSEKLNEKTSSIGIKIQAGKVWITTPRPDSFSGAITRSVETANYSATIVPETSALFSPNTIVVLKAMDIGISVVFNEKSDNSKTIFLGEGQMLTLPENGVKEIANGKNPYTFRDPISQQMLRDSFIVRSYSRASMNEQLAQGRSSTDGNAMNNENLVILEPQNNQKSNRRTIHVRGRVNTEKIKSVRINNSDAPIDKDGTFSTDISLTDNDKSTVHIEAQDSQGLTLAQEDRTVILSDTNQDTDQSSVKPVKVTSPTLDNNQTFVTQNPLVEVTGEAPPATAGIMVNDYKLQLFRPHSRTWSYLANAKLGNLAIGKNTLDIYALDDNGNKSEAVRIVIDYQPEAAIGGDNASSADTTPLKQNAPLSPRTLSVTSPQSGTQATVRVKEVLLEGNTSGDTENIFINGYKLQLYTAGKTTWNYIASVDLATMKEGKNIYRIVSRNKMGEILDLLEYTIDYQP